MSKLFRKAILITLFFGLLALSACSEKLSPAAVQAEPADSSATDTQQMEEVPGLKTIEVTNLNDPSNAKVTIAMPEGWTAMAYIYDKYSGFEYNSEKNKNIKKVYSYQFFNENKKDKTNQYDMPGLCGGLEDLGYYRDEPESTRFPNHSQMKEKLYSGNTILGEGEIFLLDCDLPRELRTEEYTTYDMVYAWIPIDNENLAYNLTITVPLGEKPDESIKIAKKMLQAK